MPRSATLPRLPRKTKLGFREQAFELLGIDEADVLVVPKIEPLLKRVFEVPVVVKEGQEPPPVVSAVDRVWMYLETSSDPMAQALIAQKYKLVNKSQRCAIPFEAYCVAAKLDPGKVWKMIVSEVLSQNQQAAELMASVAQPAVVQATIDRAVEPGGTREREMLHKHSRFVPVPQTSVTFVSKAGKVVGGDDNSQTLVALPPIEKTVRDISDRFNERLLSAPREDLMDVEIQEGDDDDVEAEASEAE